MEIKHLQAKKSKYPIFIFEGLQDSWEAEENITVLPFKGERGGKFFQNIFERFMIEGKEFGAVRHSPGIGRLVGQVAGNLLGDDEAEDIVYEQLFGFLGNMTEKFLNTLGPDRELRKAYQKLTVLFSQYPDPYAKALLLKAQTLSGNVTFLTQTQHGTWIWPNIASIVKNSIVQRYDTWAKNCHTMAQEVTRNLANIRSESEKVGLGQKIFFSRNYEVVYSNEIARIRSEIWENFNIIIEKRETLRPDLSQKIFPKKRSLWEN